MGGSTDAVGDGGDHRGLPGVIDLQLRVAIENSPVGTALLDTFGRLCFVNVAAAALLGHDRDELIGRPLSSLVHREDRTIRLEDLTDLVEGRITAMTSEWRLLTPARTTERWVRSHLSVVPKREVLAAAEAAGTDPADLPDGTGADGDRPGRARYLVQFEEVTELRRLAARLERSGTIARAALDGLAEGIIVVDTTGAVHRMNRAARELLGHRPEELAERFAKGEWRVTTVDGHAVPLQDTPAMRVASTGEAVRDERYVWRRADGEPIVVEVSVIPGDFGIDVPDGVHALLIAFTDVTAEQRARSLVDTMLETAPAGIALFEGGTSTLVRCNPAFARQLGRPIDELVGCDILSLFRPDDVESLLEWGRAVLTGTDDATREQRIECPDGSVVWVEATMARVRELDPTLVVIATFDVTERRDMVQRLDRFRHLFEHANDLIAVIDAEGDLLYASPSHLRMLGLSRMPSDREVLAERVHPDDRAEAEHHIGSIFAGARSAGPFQIRLRTGSGEWRHMETLAVNLLDEPSVAGIVLTSRDVTDRVRLVEQLEHRAAHDVLTELPNRSLFEERLEQALARAERSGERVGLCFVDLDQFKSVNDTLGHAVGDRVLQQVADRLREAVRASDTAARIGGDEFVVILDPVGSEEEAVQTAERICEMVLDPPLVAAGDVPLGVSFGVAVSEPGEPAERLQVRADQALYRAKSRSGGAVELGAEPPGSTGDDAVG